MSTALTHPTTRLTHHLRLSARRPLQHVPLRNPFRTPLPFPIYNRTYATARPPVTDKSRILEKPTRFNPPSHGARRLKPRQYPGAPLTEHDREVHRTKQYPNMMPPEGSFMYSFLTDRRVHLWITLGTLTFLAFYSLAQSFLYTTIYRQELPYWSDLLSHPFQTVGQFFTVYKRHVAYESEKVAEKRRQKLADAQKRKEFLREHGVEPGFLTGGWMDKFGTVEGDRWRAEREAKSKRVDAEVDADGEGIAGPDVDGAVAMAAGSMGAGMPGGQEGQVEDSPRERKEKKKVKMWLGIW